MNSETLLGQLNIARKNENRGITFISGTDAEEKVSYKALYAKMLLCLGYLQSRGLQPGDEVVFQIDDNKDFLISFWACIAGGFIPVPLSVSHHKEGISKLLRVWQVLNTPVLLTTTSNFEKLGKHIDVDSSVNDRVLFVYDAKGHEIGGAVHQSSPDDIAFIQFSSGSTGDPKGVALTHTNLLKNIEGIITGASLENGHRIFSWMPLTHDMGLIGFHLTPVVLGADQYIMPTELFIRHPLLWIHNLSKRRIHVTSSPNFGYQHCLKFFNEDKLQGVDLSSVCRIFNGAEPISAEVCRQFLDAFKPFGLKQSAMFTVYGLAEASLAVTFPRAGRPMSSIKVDRRSLGPGQRVELISERALEMVNCGKPISFCELRISDENGKPVEEGTVGFVHIRGENVTKGYYNNPEATARTIDSDGWLNTGDLGFIYKDDTFITGRMKEIIYVAGQNIYPHDLERVAEELDEIEGGKVVACGIPNESAGIEDIVLFVLFKRKAPDFLPLLKKLKKHITTAVGIEVAHMIPVRKIPKTTSGKIKRVAMAEEFISGTYEGVLQELRILLEEELQETVIANDNNTYTYLETYTWIRHWLSKRLQLPVEEITATKSFEELGMTSLIAVEFSRAIETDLGLKTNPTIAWNFPDMQSLAKGLCNKEVEQDPLDFNQEEGEGGIDEPIAIVGMACRFPGADSPDEYWTLLEEGRSGIREVENSRWNREYILSKAEKTITRGGYLNDIDHFDAPFFRIAPVEAEHMDPQQRLVLEVAWHALEDAGIPEDRLSGSDTGVFIGASSSDYSSLQLNNLSALNAYSGTGNSSSIIANRISYLFDLTGPSIAVDTACSSSLVAVHQACQSLKLGESDTALAGGVNLIINPALNVVFTRAGMLSEDGNCRTFDTSANGYVRGEGCGMVVLKRLKDAIRDNDRVHAIIKGSAINQDGKSNGLTAPNGRAQQAVIEKALLRAKVSPGQLGYMEAHGTGTPLGDPIELHALAEVIDKGNDCKKCLVGSAKANIGHLEAAAGVAGLIKTVLTLKNRKVPKLLHYRERNPHIRLKENSGICFPEELTPWETEGRRLAGVSSFGFGGTNAHLVLEEALPVVEGTDKEEKLSHYPIVITAKTGPTLEKLTNLCCQWVAGETPDLASISYMTTCRRTKFGHAKIVVVKNRDELLTALNTAPVITLKDTPNDTLFFLFNGGTATVSLLKEALSNFAGLEDIRDCFEQFFESGENPRSPEKYPTVISLLFGIGMARCYLTANINSASVMGTGKGRLAAACFSGAITLQTAVGLAGKLDEGKQEAWKTVEQDNAYRNGLIPLLDEVTLEEVTAIGLYLRAGLTAEPHDNGKSKITGDHRILGIGIAPEDGSLDGQQYPGFDVTQGFVPQFLECLAKFFSEGFHIKWDMLYTKHFPGFADKLPQYPFERSSYWVKSRESSLDWLPGAEKADETEDLLKKHTYESYWKKSEVLPEVSFPDNTYWVLFTEEEGHGHAVLQQLQAAGQNVSVIPPGRKATEDIARYLNEIPVNNSTSYSVHCLYFQETTGMEEPFPEDHFRLIEVARAINRNAEEASLHVITKNVQPVGKVELEGLLQSPLWGIGKTIALEMKENWGGLIDLGDQSASLATKLILSEICDPSSEDLVVYRDRQRYVYRLRKGVYTHAAPITCDANGVYLVTGGLGYLGLRLTRALIGQGAKKVVLTSRKGMPSATGLPDGDSRKVIIDELGELQSLGAEVKVVKMDASNKADIQNTIQSIAQQDLLKGVFHLAGITEYHPVDTMNREQFMATAAPKVSGSWYLHHFTRDLPLEHFACFSSATAVFGGKAQAHYAAGNQFMDQLAHYRRSLGLPALTIDLGPVAGGGMAEKNKLMFNSIGITELEPSNLIYNILCLMNTEATQVLISSVDWNRFRELYEHYVNRPVSEDLTENSGEASTGTSPFLKQLASLPVDEREEVLKKHIRSQITSVLGYKNPVPDDKGFFDLGIDSISALVIKEKLESGLRVKLHQTVVFDYPTVNDIMRYFKEELMVSYFTTPLTTPEENNILPEYSLAEGLPGNLDQMTESELEDVLKDQLKNIL
ncbi:beta-ketoacyl synthase N-terminal-like domain-containing protein [Sinomicrobium weinanense]|uniref:AMP-binding protein n=1 Tax=Sinomicrobium weinanense TaxID=2842200 RepID=A0A926JQ44_9FLAO|nr:beta-ketoacyl synthase N-terminal-like domain-containing protein [Sinomicrobium weinanense]MBC9795258.1 AMP-binding protein [Sinomicrobium weinanense]MBU3125730.1 AMP-binding protein [Sinomicrobium weinanense]